jgi:hypothetical protein
MLKKEPRLHDTFYEGSAEGEVITVTHHKEETQIGVEFLVDLTRLTLFYNAETIEPYKGGWHKK